MFALAAVSSLSLTVLSNVWQCFIFADRHTNKLFWPSVGGMSGDDYYCWLLTSSEGRRAAWATWIQSFSLSQKILSFLGSDCKFNHLQKLHSAALISDAACYEPTTLSFPLSWNKTISAIHSPSSWGNSWQKTATDVLMPPVRCALKAAPVETTGQSQRKKSSLAHCSGQRQIQKATHSAHEIISLTYSQTIAEVMHAVTHDHHPGNAGDPSVLHLLVWVAVPSVGVSVAVGVSVMLHPLLILLGGNIQWQLGCRRLGGLDFCELRVIVTIVAGGGAGFWVWRSAKRVMVVQRNKVTQGPFLLFLPSPRGLRCSHSASERRFNLWSDNFLPIFPSSFTFFMTWE